MDIKQGDEVHMQLDFTWKQVIAGAFIVGSMWASIGYSMNMTLDNRHELDLRAPYIQKVDELKSQGALTRTDVKELNKNMVNMTMAINNLVVKMDYKERSDDEQKRVMNEVKDRLRKIEIQMNRN